MKVNKIEKLKTFQFYLLILLSNILVLLYRFIKIMEYKEI